MKLVNFSGVEIRCNEYVVLKDIDFSVENGELVYLVGKVGSGKSSLFKTMYADLPVSAGAAEVLGFDLTTVKRRDVPALRRSMGIVFQDFQLLTDRTVQANLDFVLRATGDTDPESRQQRIADVLRQVAMTNKSYKMPHQLSGGEQQRIAIARALLNKPSLILADEPTGNLDPETGEQIFYLLHTLATGNTSVIIATHNHSLIDKYPGRVFLCEDHRMSELP